MQVKVKGYNKTKYIAESKDWEIEYTNVKSWEVKTIPAEEILKETDESNVDEYNEYLIIYFENGATSTFRNSHVDLFII